MKKFVPENAAQLNPNDVKGGTAPEQPVQLPPFTTTDQTGQEFGLEQLQVWLLSCASCCAEEELFDFFHTPTKDLHQWALPLPGWAGGWAGAAALPLHALKCQEYQLALRPEYCALDTSALYVHRSASDLPQP